MALNLLLGGAALRGHLVLEVLLGLRLLHALLLELAGELLAARLGRLLALQMHQRIRPHGALAVARTLLCHARLVAVARERRRRVQVAEHDGRRLDQLLRRADLRDGAVALGLAQRDDGALLLGERHVEADRVVIRAEVERAREDRQAAVHVLEARLGAAHHKVRTCNINQQRDVVLIVQLLQARLVLFKEKQLIVSKKETL